MALSSICLATEHSEGESSAMNEKLSYIRLYTDKGHIMTNDADEDHIALAIPVP